MKQFKKCFIGIVFLVATSCLFLSVETDAGAAGRTIQHEAGSIKGTVISGDDKEVIIRGDKEGRVIVVKVRNRRRADGTVGPIEEISEFISALKTGDKVEVDYGYAIEGEFYYIKTITQNSGKTGVFMRETNVMAAWVTELDGENLTVESIETGKVLELKPRLLRNDKGESVKNIPLINIIKKLNIGQKVLVGYRGQSWQGYWVQNLKVISF